MATINIRRDVADPFYRYKMERIQSKIEGKGNGIKSVIVNLSSIAHSLSRDPAYVVKFFGFELGAQVTANPSDDRYIINGAHDASKLQDSLDGFINRFVLCGKCKNPETDLIVTKDGQIIRDCKACGQRTDVDLRHKLSGYIVKNPPKKEKKEKKSSGKGKKGKKDKDGESPKDSGSEGLEEDMGIDGGSDDELTKRIRAEAKDLPSNGNGSTLKDDDWAVDMSEEAIKARAQNLPDDLKKALVLEGEEGEDSPYDVLGKWIVSEKEENGGEINGVKVYQKAQELGIEKKHRTLQVLAQTLFDGSIIKKNQVKAHAGLLKKMITSDRHEKALLGGTERFVGIDHPELTNSIPSILMAYYEHELATEETITNWGTKASKKYVDVQTSKKVRKAAEPFLKWLQEAEDDDSDDDEEDE
ncbi:domain found in IF2B/IF5-domain-containing protein [Sphaerosporella brunnea]|uniref:Domain found in IF2B/IF5-domain-containing protein n=1 Tax=Sphaerosporella brunnea TaxID=1250544 RepID=A0A5J5F894_9PEZI|nr:domain found in IF2B/IF5-domain-containing protein [Sphaerosporella brunnea]